MQKKYIVRLTDEERLELQEVAKKLKGSSRRCAATKFVQQRPERPKLGLHPFNRVCILHQPYETEIENSVKLF